jgi:sugar phosphate permease
MALGMVTSSTGIGGLFYPPMVTALIATIGWRSSWLVLSGTILVLVVGLAGLVIIRDKPEDMGLQPDGEPASLYIKQETVSTPVVSDEKSEWRIREVLKNRNTWLIGAFGACNAFVMGTMNVHQVAYLQDIGFSPMMAASAQSVMAGLSIVGSVSFGMLALKIDIRRLAMMGFLSQLLSLVILLTTRQTVLIYLYSILLGLGNGLLFTALPTFVGVYYRREMYARTLGIIFPFFILFQAVAGFMGGVIYDTTSTYTPAFIFIAFCTLVGMAASFSVGRHKDTRPNAGYTSAV